MQSFICPFCSLLCDDIRLEIKNNSFVPLNSNCLILKKSLKRKIKDHFPRIKGKKTTMSIAIEELAKLIKKSKSILFAGMGTDTKGTKVSLDILDKFGGTIDHFSGDSYSKNLKSIQEIGGVYITLSELKNRCDTIIIIETTDQTVPRLFEKYIFPKETINKIKKRKIVYIGSKKPQFLLKNKNRFAFNSIYLNSQNLLNLISQLRQKINNNSLDSTKDKNLTFLFKLLKNTNYGSIILSASELDKDLCDLIINEINLLIQDLNKFTRFAGMFLSGIHHLLTVNEVLLWQTGFPIRTNFSKGYPRHNIDQFSTTRLLAKKEVDLVVWIDSFHEEKITFKKNIKSVLLGIPTHPQKKNADIFIPLGTPGLDHNSHLFRVDKVVSMHLKKIRNISLPSVFEVLSKVKERI
mgnify:FL=1